jgi:hypothetical protein
MSEGHVSGAFIFPEEWQSWTPDDAARHCEALAAQGINAIFTESESYDDRAIEIAHANGLRWIGGIACFSDHGHQNRLLEERPELWPIDATGARRQAMEWYVGVTPTFEDYAASRVALATRLVAAHPLDGFVLDFIRWPIHWELELRPGAARIPEASFDPHTLRRFELYSGLRIPFDHGNAAACAEWITRSARSTWVDFKCSVITSVVRDCADRIRVGTTLGIYAVPLPPAELAVVAGQRLSELAPLVDWVLPMAYHAILHQPLSWVSDMIDAASGAAPGKVLPVVQISANAPTGADWGPPISTAEASAVLRAARHRPDILGVVAFPAPLSAAL